MNKTLKKITLCALALIAVGAAKVNAATEMYDFTTFNGEPINQNDEHYATGTTLYLLAVDGNNFNNRFAIGPKERTGTGGFYFRIANDTYKGLYSQYADRNFSILNLVKGNRVTLTLSNNAETLKFVNGDVVESGKTYTVEAGNLDFVTTGSVYIEKVVIEEPVLSVPVTVGVAGYAKTYNLVQAAEGSTVLPTWGAEVKSGGVDLNLLATADNTFDNRIAVGPKSRNNDSGNCFKFRTSGDWKGLWSQYADRNISILNLKKGDKVTFTISKNESTLKFVGGNAVVSGQAYTVEADGNLDFVTTGSVYIEDITISKEEQNIGGATLVSSSALDFTSATVKAYIATAAEGGSVTFSRVKKVPANTPLYLKAASVITEDIPVLTGDPEAITTNLLKGSATAATPLTSTTATKYYVFGVLNGDAGFYPVGTSKLTSAAGKAYLELTAAQATAAAASARSISMIFEHGSETTGISTAKVNTQVEDNAWYTLQGVRVAQPTRGIYVRNGKKIIVK